MRGPEILPWCITRNTTLNLNTGAAENGDLHDHARRRLAGSNYSEHHFGSFRISIGGVQQMSHGHCMSLPRTDRRWVQ